MDLKAAREQLDLTQQQLAEKLGCSQGLIALYENGTRRPGWQNAKKIAEVLGVPVKLIRPDIFSDDRSAA